ncbi:hypothetical protein W911_08380 [Hyphomicrobium nitrativorans NL23]|uniref:Uncharacterized protein n=1 Tax=Hyphomicrobium nitrativorans NL23 TaxID=1029756 RepID=V5SJ48_9HYPH|nr:DUF4164 family protein [Hyphomicrobium nitrativorans]AHB50115.1 hypothetical protein W911_08380 [Hyphomicrobium nitrativorans NL23]
MRELGGEDHGSTSEGEGEARNKPHPLQDTCRLQGAGSTKDCSTEGGRGIQAGGYGRPPARLETRIKSLEQERDRLKSDLEAAHMRIAALEESRSAVANRIDWVIERLGGVVERGD